MSCASFFCVVRITRRTTSLLAVGTSAIAICFLNGVVQAQQVWPVWNELSLTPDQRQLLESFEGNVQQLDIAKAIAAAKEFTPERFPGDQADAAGAAAFAIAITDYLRGDIFSAEDKLKTIHQHPDGSAYLKQVARAAHADLLVARQQFLAAKKLLQAAVQDAPNDVQATFKTLSAGMAISDEQFSEAEKMLADAEQSLPPNGQAPAGLASRIRLAQARLEGERFRLADAQRILQETQADTPYDVLAKQLVLASALWQAKDDTGALREYSAALAVLQRAFGATHFRAVSVRSNVALLQTFGSAAGVAGEKVAMDQAVKDWRAIFGDRIEEYPTYWFQLGQSQLFTNPLKVFSTTEKAIEVARSALGDDSPTVVKAFALQGTLKSNILFGGSPEQGLKFVEQALAISPERMRESPSRAGALQVRAGIVLRWKRDFARAEQDLTEALEILEGAYCDDAHPDSLGLVDVLEELHNLYEKSGQTDLAKRTAARIDRCKALAANPRETSEDIEREVAAINELAKDPAKIPDASERAKKLMQRLTEEADSIPDSVPVLADHLLKMAAIPSLDPQVYRRLIKDDVYKKFNEKLQQVAARAEMLTSPTKNLTFVIAELEAQAAELVGNLGTDPDAPAKIVDLYKRRVDLINKHGGRVGPSGNDPLSSVGASLATFSAVDGFRLFMLEDEAHRLLVEQALAIKSEAEVEQAIEQLQVWHNTWLDMLVRHLSDQQEFVAQAHERLLRHKGLLRQAVTTFHRPGRNAGSDLWKQLVDVRKRLKHAQFLTRNPDSETIRKLREEQAELERKLQRDTTLQAATEASNPTIDEIVTCLPEGAALVDYVVYRPVEEVPWAERQKLHDQGLGLGPDRRFAEDGVLLAFVLDTRAKLPVRLVRLCSTNALADQIQAWTASNYYDPEKTSQPDRLEKLFPAAFKQRCEERAAVERTLAELIWDPLWQGGDAPSRVVISPDGELNKFSFVTLRDDGNHPLVEQGVVVSYITSARKLVVPRADLPERSNSPALAVGVSQFAGIYRPLENVPHEIKELRDLWDKSNVASRAPLVEDQATLSKLKESLKQNPNPRFLHIASHGFAGPWEKVKYLEQYDASLRAADARSGSGLSWTMIMTLVLLGAAACVIGMVLRRNRRWRWTLYGIGGSLLTVSLVAFGVKQFWSPQPPSAESLGDAPDSAVSVSVEKNNSKKTSPVPSTEQSIPREVALVVLSEAKGPRKGPSGEGLLFSDDVAGLSLAGTQIVTLSSCETATGRVVMTQGMRGLREAFLIAGAENFVSAVAEVGDEDARAIIRQFYEQVLSGEKSDGSSPADGLHRSIQIYRENLRSNAGADWNDDSSRWGLFVLESSRI